MYIIFKKSANFLKILHSFQNNCTFPISFLLQASYNMTNPAVLQKDLVDLLKMTDSKADTFFNVWRNSAKGIVDRLRQKSIHHTQVLDLKCKT